MKKPLLLVLSVTSAITITTRSFGQGELLFANTRASQILLINVYTGTSTRMFGSAGTFDIGLYMGSAGSTSISAMQLVATAASPNATTSTIFNAGVFSYTGGTVNSPGNVANTLNFAAGTQYAFFVAGWAAYAGSYDNAIATQAPNGISTLGFITPVSSPTPVPSVFGTSAGQIDGFVIFVPEPSTLALGSVGAAVILLFRRRK